MIASSLSYLFAFVFVLSLVVILHEGGHFLAARICGIKVLEFSLGFGKKIWGRMDKKGTYWKICLIPLGGYVKMLGDEDASSTKHSTKNISKDDYDKTFLSKNLWQRAFVIFSGPGFNYLSAFVILFFLFWRIGSVVIPPIVGEVLVDSIAQKNGILPGDVIQNINGREIDSFSEIKRSIQLTEYGRPLQLIIKRDDEKILINIDPLKENADKEIVLGILAKNSELKFNEKLSFWDSIKKSSETIYFTTTDTLKYLWQIITGKRLPKDLRGPLGIAEASGDAFKGGWIVLLSFIANISIGVGLMNLLPIPVLDGGHLFFYLVEAIIRRPLSDKIQNICFRLGLLLLLLMFLYSMFLDVPRILERIFQ